MADAPTRRRGRPARIDQARIVDAAIGLGVDALTMQALAARLGVTTPALYTHVANRDEVLRLVAEAIESRICEFAADTDDWRSWLRAFARLVHDHLAPSVVTVLSGHRSDDTVGRVGIAEHGIALLMAEGLTAEDAGRTIWHVYRLALTSGTPGERLFARHLRETESVLGAESPPGLPSTHAVQLALASADHDPLTFDLDLVIAGLEARIRSSPDRPI